MAPRQPSLDPPINSVGPRLPCCMPLLCSEAPTPKFLLNSAVPRSGLHPTDTVDFVVIDVETACSCVSNICQIGIVGFCSGAVAFEYETFSIRTITSAAQYPRPRQRRRLCRGQAVFCRRARRCRRTLDRTNHGCARLVRQGRAGGSLPRARPDDGRDDLARQRACDKMCLAGSPQPQTRRGFKRPWHPLRHCEVVSDTRGASMIVVKAIDHTGMP